MKRDFRSLFRVRIQSIPVDRPLAYNIYLNIAMESVLFRKRGDTITSERMRHLLEHSVRDAFLPIEHKKAYLDSLRDISKNDSAKTEERGKYLKELAFTYVQDLFQKPELEDLVTESVGVVTEMVDFISGDLEAAAALMKLSTHDFYTYNHSVNVAVYAIAIARKVVGDDKDFLIRVGLGGLLHDIGKRKISSEIITKPGRLTPEESSEIKKHPEYGLELVQNSTVVPEETRRIIHEHHENVDGSGYPRGICHEEIAKVAKICAIADVFDALTTNRSYKAAVSPLEALQIMYTMQPGKFDNSLFTHFDKSLNTKIELTIDKHFDPCVVGSKIKKVS